MPWAAGFGSVAGQIAEAAGAGLRWRRGLRGREYAVRRHSGFQSVPLPRILIRHHSMNRRPPLHDATAASP